MTASSPPVHTTPSAPLLPLGCLLSVEQKPAESVNISEGAMPGSGLSRKTIHREGNKTPQINHSGLTFGAFELETKHKMPLDKYIFETCSVRSL